MPEAGNCDPVDSTYGALLDTTSSTGTTTAATSTCKFIANYMHSANAQADKESEFVDPTGDPYRLHIAEYNAGNIKDGNNTLANTDYSAKIVYLTTKSRCDGERVIGTSNKRDYSILYKLEGSGVYCKDNGSYYFVRSGDIHSYHGSLKDSGYVGYNWSHTSANYSSATSASSYDFVLSLSGIDPSHGPRSRYLGFPVRCLVY